MTERECMQALHELLKQTHRGYIIPPRPEKNTVEGQRASDEFVTGRKAAIARYLNSLAAHPVIGESQVSLWGVRDLAAWQSSCTNKGFHSGVLCL